MCWMMPIWASPRAPPLPSTRATRFLWPCLSCLLISSCRRAEARAFAGHAGAHGLHLVGATQNLHLQLGLQRQPVGCRTVPGVVEQLLGPTHCIRRALGDQLG